MGDSDGVMVTPVVVTGGAGDRVLVTPVVVTRLTVMG